ncbi:hypothetical protein O9993_18465 [Vibrio lentus]|nr:hypothetical protein [Vibrio lentus]
MSYSLATQSGQQSLWSGMGIDGRTLVTRSNFRFLNSLYTMGPSQSQTSPVLWSEQLPDGFKRFCARGIYRYFFYQCKENDDLMRPDLDSDDYAIACCVSPMIVSKQMQFFGSC